METENIKALIRANDDAYFYSMRTLHDRIDRDEWNDRFERELATAQRKEKSRRDAIASRRREMFYFN